ESSNIRQQKNSSSNIFLHNLTVALNLTIQLLSNSVKSVIKFYLSSIILFIVFTKIYCSTLF
ncbi:hypothetical protein CYJ81_10165, partial [Lactobacillus crispatus]